MNLALRVARWINRISVLPHKIYRIQEALGRIEQRQVEALRSDIADVGFRVFSQWEEDGIIQFLVKNIKLDRKIFIEFGVENYTESNTRFLLSNNHWSGLVLDGNKKNIEFIKADPIYWACNLKAEYAFVTSENINELFARNGILGDIGLLSIDIDGNDYWIWNAINCINPRIVVCEYNSLFGPVAKVSVPYNPSFVRTDAHFSRVYYGASISALCELATSKGYSLVASNAEGNNVFFVRNDLLENIHAKSVAEVYRAPQFRECHDQGGRLTYCDSKTSLKMIAHLELYDFATNSVKKIEDIPGICG